MKKITVNIKAYIQSVVDLEEKVMWASKPNIAIPELKDNSCFEKNSVGSWNFIKKEVNAVLP